MLPANLKHDANRCDTRWRRASFNISSQTGEQMWTRNWWNAASLPLLKGAFNSGFVVRSAVVTGMGCLPLPGNRRLLPADWPEGFETPTCWESSEFCFQHLENPFIPVNKPPKVRGRCFLFPPNTEKKRRKWRKKKSQTTFLHAFTSGDLFSLAARPAPVSPD